MSRVICFGEVLWDVFPEHKKIGGAPLNVALRLKSYGNDVVMISAVGSDSDGKKLLEFIEDNGIDLNDIQIKENFKTSQVKVYLDEKGAATYTIEYPCAWDEILLTETSKKAVIQSDAFIFGSLVTRHGVSRNTLSELLQYAKFKVFDVNLRAPHYTMEVLGKLMEVADFIKFNDDELLVICRHFKSKSDDLEESIKFIANKTNTQNICVTLGSDGAMLYKDGVFYKSKGYAVTVKDSVGAGDSFLATLINDILNTENPQEAINYACAVGALVASKEGANPIITSLDIKKIME